MCKSKKNLLNTEAPSPKEKHHLHSKVSSQKDLFKMNIYCNDTKNSKADPLGSSVLTTDCHILRLNRQQPHKGNYTFLPNGIFAIANGNNKMFCYQ